MDRNNNVVTETEIYYDDGTLSCRIEIQYNRFGRLVGIFQYYTDGSSSVLCGKELDSVCIRYGVSVGKNNPKEYYTKQEILLHRSDLSDDI